MRLRVAAARLQTPFRATARAAAAPPQILPLRTIDWVVRQARALLPVRAAAVTARRVAATEEMPALRQQQRPLVATRMRLLSPLAVMAASDISLVPAVRALRMPSLAQKRSMLVRRMHLPPQTGA